MEEKNLQFALSECKELAEKGYKAASEQEIKLRDALSVAQNELQETIEECRKNTKNRAQSTNFLEEQLEEVRDSLKKISIGLHSDLENLRNNLGKFSVTLFGRTMAGKSTLMEILTEGDGDSIGKGAQRTTRDIRRYNWNGLEIMDVPGIGAFEGEKDERIAFEAAKNADLIIFLMTDDAPQFVEAECFSKIMDLGKPIICVMNVKASIEGKGIKLALRDVNKRFNLERLADIRKQFLLFAEQYGQSWTHIPFIYVHLKSAFLALKTDEQEARRCYYDISRISILKNQIEKQIEKKGKFYRIKNFVDAISNPIALLMENLLEQGQLNWTQRKTILDKKQYLNRWRNNFLDDGESRIKSLIIKIKSDLARESDLFIEEHFNDKNADNEWLKILKSRNIGKQCQEVISDLDAIGKEKIEEISREVENELKFKSTFWKDKSLRMSRVVDSKKYWKWFFLTAEGVLTIAGLVTTFLGLSIAAPIGIATVVVGGLGILGGYLFKSREEKEKKARQDLKTKLTNYINQLCDDIEDKMQVSLKEIIKNIDGFMDGLTIDIVALERLAEIQKNLASKLRDCILEQNKFILLEAFQFIDVEGLDYPVQTVLRIPGNISLLLMTQETIIPQKLIKEIQELMEEKIETICDSDCMDVLISRIIGVEKEKVAIDYSQQVVLAHISQEHLCSKIKTRLRLAQQYSKLIIVSE